MYLSGTDLEPMLAEMRKHEMLARDIWRETTLLAVGHLSVIQHTPDRAAQLIERLLREELRGDARGLNVVRAGEALRDVGRAGVTDAVWNATLDALKTTMQSATHPPKTRAAAGESLDALGWLPDDLDTFVYIPGNESKPRSVNEFWIGKYPVTCAQYQKFIDAGGYANEKYWRDQRGVDEKGREKKLGDEAWDWLKERGGAERRPYYWDNPRFHRAGYPVIGVTWYEASAYCRWRTEEFKISDLGFMIGNTTSEHPKPLHRPQGQVSEILNHKFIVRLPTELEWVRAAGGDENNRYAWEPTVTPALAAGASVASPEGTTSRKRDAQSPSRGLGIASSQNTLLAMTPDQRKEIVLARANVEESEIGGTTPVAMYPDGVRVTEGGNRIFDLAGNVWEWTSMIDEKNWTYQRGGSWYSNVDGVSVSSRDHWLRGYDFVRNGFRVFAQ